MSPGILTCRTTSVIEEIEHLLQDRTCPLASVNTIYVYNNTGEYRGQQTVS